MKAAPGFGDVNLQGLAHITQSVASKQPAPPGHRQRADKSFTFHGWVADAAELFLKDRPFDIGGMGDNRRVIQKPNPSLALFDHFTQ
jgi:hypothetical protein